VKRVRDLIFRKIKELVENEVSVAERMTAEALDIAERALENPNDRKVAFEIYERLVSFGRHSPPFIVDELTDWKRGFSERYLVALLDGARAILPHNSLFAEYLYKGLLNNKELAEVNSDLFQLEYGRTIALSLTTHVAEMEEFLYNEREAERLFTEAGNELLGRVAVMLERREMTQRAAAGVLRELEDVKISNVEALEKLVFTSSDLEVQKLATEKLLETQENVERLGLQGFRQLAEYLTGYRNVEALLCVGRASNSYGVYPREETMRKIKSLSEEVYEHFKCVPYERKEESKVESPHL